VRRFITKAATPLFAGEPMGKKYRIALDEIAGRPKKSKQMENVDNNECPISGLILQAAMENLSEEVLLRTPQESFEMLYGEVADNNSSSNSQRQSHQNLIIQDWQDDRKKEDEFQRE
jgi:broad-specificity NMP kinase